MERSEATRELLRETGQALSGSARRRFMARSVQALGRGGKEWVQKVVGWSGVTIRKGLHELESGIECVDACNARGRKRAEEHLPNLLADIRAIVDGQSQTDPSFKSSRLYTRMTAKETRKQLIEQKGYSDEELPCTDVVRERLNELGYRVRAVGKSKPQKR